jgi:hypothetical protein
VILLVAAFNAFLDASIQWRDHRQDFLKKIGTLSEKAKKRVPTHIKIPHPDTDPEERSTNPLENAG